MKLSKIFEEKPKQWGFRGDPYFWNHLKGLAENMDMISPDELENWIKKEYRSLSGKALTNEYVDFLVDSYDWENDNESPARPSTEISDLRLLQSRHPRPRFETAMRRRPLQARKMRPLRHVPTHGAF